MSHKIIKQNTLFSVLNSEESDFFMSKFTPTSYIKGDYFIREGQYNNFVGFIVKGCLMCSFNKDGKEYIEEFSFENEFITDYRSLLTDTPSDKNIICLEDSELLVIQYSEMQEMYKLKPIYERVGRLVAESLFMNWQEKAKSFLLDDAEERYLKLIEQKPTLVQRVPQYLIASYLGVSPETLSRIRKKITR